MLTISALLLALSIPSTCSYRFIPESEEHFQYVNPLNKQSVKISDVPHQVLVVYDSYYCSGSLIFSRIVLTVASCFKSSEVRCAVKVGANSVTSMGQLIPVIETKVHEYYDREVPYNNDIALLMMERNAVFGENVRKAIIVEPEISIRVGTTLDVAGWGGNNLPAKFVHRLLLSEMKITSDEECLEKYGLLKTQSKYCARYQPERRLSDNGGSAMLKDHNMDLMVGILSYGATRTEESDCLALLTNVSYFHRWIIFNSQKLLLKHCVEDKIQDSSSYEYNETSENYDYDVQQLRF